MDRANGNAADLNSNAGYYWLFAFLPAFTFYLHLLSHTFNINHYPTISDKVILAKTSSKNYLFESLYLENTNNNHLLEMKKSYELTLKHGFELLWYKNETFVENDDSKHLNGLTGLTWREDEELGRGYLLFSDVSGNRIWRWEVGGGPIAIGRTLYMERSGCRSNETFCENGNGIGSTGLGVEVGGKMLDGSNNGKLVVCERGERRIVRLEEDGARTPIASHTPGSKIDMESGYRLNGPQNIVYTPFGDLIFTDPMPYAKADKNLDDNLNEFYGSGGIWRVPEASLAAPIKASKSRKAHFIREAPRQLVLLYSRFQRPLGIAISHDLDSLFVTNSDDLRIYRLPIGALDEDESDRSRPRRRLRVEEDYDEEIDYSNLDSEELDKLLNEIEIEDEEEDVDEYIKLLEDEMTKIQETDSQDLGIQDVDSVIIDEASDFIVENVHKREVVGMGVLDSVDPNSLVFFDIAKLNLNCSQLGGIKVDAKWNVWVAGGSCGILMFSESGIYQGRVPTPVGDEVIDLNFGGDGFLYATTLDKLLRIKSKEKSLKIPDMRAK